MVRRNIMPQYYGVLLWQAVCFKREKKSAFAARQLTCINISLGQIDVRKFHFGHDFCPRYFHLNRKFCAIISFGSARDSVS